ncbi:MAG: FdhF/YdeP family oxidoreductase [Thermoleophilia bacterium]|nr:FdhF/YdeP family oxidoreductase [Thermoleophilia bacterium]
MTSGNRADGADDAPEISTPRDHSAGISGVWASLRHAGRAGLSRTVPALFRVNQPDGFDCPGCAWPESGHPHRAEFCENGAKAVAEETTKERAGRDFFARHSVTDLAGRSGYWLGRQGRLTEPMHLAEGDDHYRPISWEDAFSLIAGRLQSLGDPERAVFYTSGRTSNEAAFLFQLFARAFGTNNLPDCSNMCHESSGCALTETIGTGKGSVSLEDIERADVLLIVGQNPGTNHPRMLATLERAKQNGSRIITINPLPEAGMKRFRNPQRPSGLIGQGTELTDLFLQVRVNGDLALFQAIGRLILNAAASRPGGTAGADFIDSDFIETKTDGFGELRTHLDELDWDEVLEATGLPLEQIREAADLIMEADSVIACWAMGLTQHRNSVATIREIVNVLMLGGHIGRPGAGVCPVRGHSNVQGDRTMGIHENPEPGLLDALATEFGFEPPREPGFDVVDSIRAMDEGRARVFFAMGGNFASATPDSELTERALRKTDLTVQVSTKLNRSHLVTGREALILPTLGRSERDESGGGEQFVTVEDSMSCVHGSRGRLAPASADLLSEVAIVCRLAEATLGGKAGIPWGEFATDYDRIRDRIEAVIPGFADFNRRAREPGGFVLPHPPRDRREFETENGRAHFSVNRLEVLRVPPGRLLLQTMRSHDQYNTTIYGLNDRYRGIKGGRRVLLVNPDDLANLNHGPGDVVDLVSEWSDGSERLASRFRLVSYPTAPGCAAAYYPETNSLVPLDSVAEGSNTPTSKSIVIRLRPHSGDSQAGSQLSGSAPAGTSPG